MLFPLSHQVVNKLSAHCDEVRLGCRIHSVRFDASSERVHVREQSGRESEFDEVVLATQAHQVRHQSWSMFLSCHQKYTCTTSEPNH